MESDRVPIWAQIEELIDKMEVIHTIICSLAKLNMVEEDTTPEEMRTMLWHVSDLMTDAIAVASEIMVQDEEKHFTADDVKWVYK